MWLSHGSAVFNLELPNNRNVFQGFSWSYWSSITMKVGPDLLSPEDCYTWHSSVYIYTNECILVIQHNIGPWQSYLKVKTLHGLNLDTYLSQPYRIYFYRCLFSPQMTYYIAFGY